MWGIGADTKDPYLLGWEGRGCLWKAGPFQGEELTIRRNLITEEKSSILRNRWHDILIRRPVK
jgi:hypothetical protein